MDREARGDEPRHLGNVRHALDARQELLLLVPGAARRVRDRRLADGEPSEGRLVLAGGLLARAPVAFLRVEESAVEVADAEE